MLRLLAVLLALTTVGPAAALPSGFEALGLAQPTTFGEAMLAFEDGTMPALGVGDDLLGFPVVQAIPQIGILVVAAPDLTPLRLAVAGLPGLRSVEDNGKVHGSVVPNDTRYSGQYGPPQMGFPAAWGSAGYGSSAIKVAVIDSGLYKTHPDFQASRILTGYDYVNNDSNPDDGCGHGTHVTGTIAATTNNNLGVAGMSQATILPLKALQPIGGILSVECSGSTADIAQAIVDATDQGARIISMSIGASASDSATSSAVAYAYARNVLLVAAAGNDGAANSIDYPAAYSQVIAVGATTNTKARASFSDMGADLEVMAPGNAIDSTSSSGSYTTMSGTSMATPHVAGALALALSCAPSTTNTALRSALQSTAEDLGAAGRDTTYGYGLARADLLVASVCGGGPPPNTPPVASFTFTTSSLTVNVNGGGSTDADGDPLTYSWTFGDSSSGSGVTASRTYAAAGTYSVTLTVSDGRGGSNSQTKSVTVASGGGSDPDPGTPNLTSGTAVSFSIATGQEKFYKIDVPAGKSQLVVEMTGPACGLLSCSVDADLYTRLGSKPTDTTYACRPYASGSTETCTHSSPAAGYWYVRVYGYSGSGTVTLKATYT
ncbi:MAG: serine protease [Thermoplasmata archaeon]|jgi:serine protease|nr:serine protease [Thermoplasmata archaeon]